MVPVDPVAEAYQNWKTHGWDGGARLKAALSILRVEDLIRQTSGEVLAQHRLTYARHEMLAVLYFSRSGEMPMGKLGKRLMVHPTRVTSTIGSLEEAGLVERVADPNDRRTVLARITDKGREVMAESTKAMLAPQFGLGVLSEAEAEQLFLLLRKVRADAGDLDSEDPTGTAADG